MNAPTLLLLCVLGTSVAACGRVKTQDSPSTDTSESFELKWYQGQAEISRYAIEQARYGELRRGDAVLLFVTEDFRTDKFVKLEDYGGEGRSSSVPIMKMNFMLNFVTGVYPYSVMTSVFTPLDTRTYPRALKASHSAQEWCGHVYGQYTYRNGRYHYESHSYFENEADESYELEGALLEDDIWVRIRVNPAGLPTGPVKMIPGSTYARFAHRKPAVEAATAGFSESVRGGDTLVTYQITYQSYERDLALTFRKAFPHEIIEFESTSLDGFGDRARVLTTRAVRTHTMMLDYWSRNGAADTTFRKELGLD